MTTPERWTTVGSHGSPHDACRSGRRLSPIISLDELNRASNTFSVIIEVPSEIDASPIAIGCRSVGNPETAKQSPR